VRAASADAARESFVALLQRNAVDRPRCSTKQDLRLAIMTLVDATTTIVGAGDAALGKRASVGFDRIYRSFATAA
jgi:hypothetical protein